LGCCVGRGSCSCLAPRPLAPAVLTGWLASQWLLASSSTLLMLLLWCASSCPQPNCLLPSLLISLAGKGKAPLLVMPWQGGQRVEEQASEQLSSSQRGSHLPVSQRQWGGAPEQTATPIIAPNPSQAVRWGASGAGSDCPTPDCCLAWAAASAAAASTASLASTVPTLHPLQLPGAYSIEWLAKAARQEPLSIQPLQAPPPAGCTLLGQGGPSAACQLASLAPTHACHCWVRGDAHPLFLKSRRSPSSCLSGAACTVRRQGTASWAVGCC